MQPHLPPLSLFLALLILVPSQCAISQQAVDVINTAVATAIKDGLTLIDSAMRATYWYYLDGANQTGYSVSIQPDRLNYVINYTAPGSIFIVNCDLIKETWKPRLNSLVRQAGGVAPSSPPISLATQAALDLTALNASINPPILPAPPLVVITDLPKPSLTTGN